MRILVKMDTKGIGDCILGTTTVAGLRKQYPDAHITYVVERKNVDWVRLFKEANEVASKATGDFDNVYGPYSSYGHEVKSKSAKPRWVYYADVCKTEAALPTWEVPEADLKWAEEFKDRVILVPYAAWSNRSWPIQHWMALEEALNNAGHKTLVLDSPGDGKRTIMFRSFRFWGQPARKVAALILKSKLVVGNDSGMVHFAGALGQKAIAVCGPVKGKKIFGFWPTVRTLQGDLPCDGCYWQGHYYTRTCRTSCVDLGTITPRRVMQVANELLEPKLVQLEKPKPEPKPEPENMGCESCE